MPRQILQLTGATIVWLSTNPVPAIVSAGGATTPPCNAGKTPNTAKRTNEYPGNDTRLFNPSSATSNNKIVNI